MKTNFSRLTYLEWLKHYNITKEFEVCEECDSTGISVYHTYCDCNSCTGHSKEQRCETCNGTGQIDQTRKEYWNKYDEDSRRLERYNNNAK